MSYAPDHAAIQYLEMEADSLKIAFDSSEWTSLATPAPRQINGQELLRHFTPHTSHLTHNTSQNT